MLASHRTQCGAFSRSLVVILTLIAFLVPRAVYAEQLLFLFKNDTGRTTQWHNAVHRNAKQSAVFRLNKNGDLVVKCGSINLALAYNQTEDSLKQPEPVRHSVAMNQGPPPVSGISVSLNFTF
jgi:hypothetical protein